MSNEPTAQAFRDVGVTGLILFGILAMLSTVYMIQSTNRKNQFFFGLMVLFAVLELPRYAFLAADGEYTSIPGYCAHLIASLFFFSAFSVVVHMWSDVLQLDPNSSSIFGLRGLTALNVAYFVLDIITVGFCATAQSLQGFFRSEVFSVYTFSDAIKNLAFSLAINYVGCRLIFRLRGMRMLEGTSSQQASLNSALGRLQLASVACTVSFIVRIVMLGIKYAALNTSNEDVTDSGFKLFGIVWWLLADWIPRGVPTVAFLVLIRIGKTQRQGSKDNPSPINGGGGAGKQHINVPSDGLNVSLKDDSPSLA